MDIDEAMLVLNSAKGARVAAAWFADIEKQADSHAQVANSPVMSIQLNFGSATSEGKAANHYLQQAFREMLPQIIKLGKRFAVEDQKAGDKIIEALK